MELRIYFHGEFSSLHPARLPEGYEKKSDSANGSRPKAMTENAGTSLTQLGSKYLGCRTWYLLAAQ